ncbi:hypothetical protein P8605_09115, partial [Streptomyces sp. T-3]|nr:hypothetical protein [Streptomyces sp. T-3]
CGGECGAERGDTEGLGRLLHGEYVLATGYLAYLGIDTELDVLERSRKLATLKVLPQTAENGRDL